jgi:FemAB-related protein (PEP-CTERM system-associated)
VVDVASSLLDTRDIKSRIDDLKGQKASLGRSVGAARYSGQNVDELLKQLKTVSDEIKDLQKSLKRALNSRNQNQPIQWSPGLTEPLPAILDCQVGPFEIYDFFKDRSRQAIIDEYVIKHDAGSLWHTTGCLEFIADTYGHPASYLCAVDQHGSLVGVLPLIQLKSRLFGNILVSSPYFNYGGVLAQHRSVAEALIGKANEWRKVLGAGSIELRHCKDSGLGQPQRDDKLTFWLPLPDESTILWDSFQPKVRAQVRRAERENPEVQFGRKELLDEFYQVFARNMRDLGTPVYGKSFFYNLLETLGDSAQLVVARIRGRAVGCAFITGFRNRMEIPWASTLREYNYTCVNMLMYWRILECAVTDGYRLFDFGRCSKEAGTLRFKQQWGANPVQLNWDYVLDDGAPLPGLNPNNPKFRLLIAIWKRLPVWLSRLLGPSIVKFLP